ncbi:MAG: hypothetical protein P4L51_23790 [Puia sp.]|nr:hypothetical protein [Puia sp.]
MPYREIWIPNELFLEHNGVCIYLTYKNDEQEVLDYHFGTASDTKVSNDDETLFDIRDLSNWPGETQGANMDILIRSVLIEAIELGLLNDCFLAAIGRQGDLENAEYCKPVDRREFHAKEFTRLLSTIHLTLLYRIEALFRSMDPAAGVPTPLAHPVPYEGCEDYEIHSLIDCPIGSGYHVGLSYLQSIDGFPHPEQWFVESLPNDVLVLLLQSLEQQLSED